VPHDRIEAVVADAFEQRLAIGEMPVDGHRRQAHRRGDAAHADAAFALALEQRACGAQDAIGGGFGGGRGHVYSVNKTPQNR
jgi:hypothetical protein